MLERIKLKNGWIKELHYPKISYVKMSKIGKRTVRLEVITNHYWSDERPYMASIRYTYPNPSKLYWIGDYSSLRTAQNGLELARKKKKILKEMHLL